MVLCLGGAALVPCSFLQGSLGERPDLQIQIRWYLSVACDEFLRDTWLCLFEKKYSQLGRGLRALNVVGSGPLAFALYISWNPRFAHQREKPFWVICSFALVFASFF